MQKRLRRLTLPVTAVTAALVVCAFSGGVLGTGMLGSSAEAARSRPPDPTIPVPLSSDSSAGSAPAVTVPAPITTVGTPDRPPVGPLPPPVNVPYIVLTPPDAAGQSGPSVPSLPTVVPAPPTTTPLAVITITAAKAPTSRTAKAAAITTTTKTTPTIATTATTTIRARRAQTTTTVVAYENEPIQALPPSAVRPNVVVAGVVILADASNGTSGAGSLTPPSAPTTPQPIPQPTSPPTAPTSPLPTILITPVLTRNTPTTTPSSPVPSTAPPVSVDSGDGPTPIDPGLPSFPTTTKPKVYVFVGRNDYDIVPPVSPRAGEVVGWALAQVGQPYLWGGEGPGGFDCSGLSKMAWLSVGARLTHQSKIQFSETARLNVSDLEPGDLVFYGDPTHHLGIYIGDGKMVEAARQGIPVRIVPVKRRDLVGAGRVRY